MSDPMELLVRSCPSTLDNQGGGIWDCSFTHGTKFPSSVSPSTSSFVRSAIEAWACHSHLVIRPDDIWITILVQLNLYMTNNAERLRHLFVSHKGKRELVVISTTWPDVITGLRDQVHESIKTTWMKDWIRPDFSTTTTNDTTVAEVLLLGLMKSYFKYIGGFVCGIPSITIEGNKADWERLLQKVDRLPEFGAEPQEYASRLRPLLIRIRDTFDDPHSAPTRQFWDEFVQAKVVHRSGCGAPPEEHFISGWIQGFLYWNDEGRPDRHLARPRPHPWAMPLLNYDGVTYGTSFIKDLPLGYVKIDFTVRSITSGKDTPAWLIAGSIGTRITTERPLGYDSARLALETCRLQSEPQDAAVTHCFTSLLQIFRASKEQSMQATGTGEKANSHNATTGQHNNSNSCVEHCTMRPMSCWFLAGPPRKFAQLGWEGMELEGPTAEAIRACDDILHEWD